MFRELVRGDKQSCLSERGSTIAPPRVASLETWLVRTGLRRGCRSHRLRGGGRAVCGRLLGLLGLGGALHRVLLGQAGESATDDVGADLRPTRLPSSVRSRLHLAGEAVREGLEGEQVGLAAFLPLHLLGEAVHPDPRLAEEVAVAPAERELREVLREDLLPAVRVLPSFPLGEPHVLRGEVLLAPHDDAVGAGGLERAGDVGGGRLGHGRLLGQGRGLERHTMRHFSSHEFRSVAT